MWYFVTPTELCALLSFFDQSKGIADVNFMCILSDQSRGLQQPPKSPHVRIYCADVSCNGGMVDTSSTRHR